MYSAKTAEPIKTPFWRGLTHMGPRNNVLHEVKFWRIRRELWQDGSVAFRQTYLTTCCYYQDTLASLCHKIVSCSRHRNLLSVYTTNHASDVAWGSECDARRLLSSFLASRPQIASSSPPSPLSLPFCHRPTSRQLLLRHLDDFVLVAVVSSLLWNEHRAAVTQIAAAAAASFILKLYKRRLLGA